MYDVRVFARCTMWRVGSGCWRCTTPTRPTTTRPTSPRSAPPTSSCSTTACCGTCAPPAPSTSSTSSTPTSAASSTPPGSRSSSTPRSYPWTRRLGQASNVKFNYLCIICFNNDFFIYLKLKNMVWSWEFNRTLFKQLTNAVTQAWGYKR